MKKVDELSSDELFHIASLISHNYVYNYNTFEYVNNDDRIMLGANNCVWLQLKHKNGKLTTVGHHTKSGWVDIDAKQYYEVIGYLKDLEYVAEGYEPSTKITIDDSISLLSNALSDIITVEEGSKTDFLLDIVKSYKKQLNENYGKDLQKSTSY